MVLFAMDRARLAVHPPFFLVTVASYMMLRHENFTFWKVESEQVRLAGTKTVFPALIKNHTWKKSISNPTREPKIPTFCQCIKFNIKAARLLYSQPFYLLPDCLYKNHHVAAAFYFVLTTDMIRAHFSSCLNLNEPSGDSLWACLWSDKQGYSILFSRREYDTVWI